jgi:hypothetical protein
VLVAVDAGAPLLIAQRSSGSVVETALLLVVHCDSATCVSGATASAS